MSTAFKKSNYQYQPIEETIDSQGLEEGELTSEKKASFWHKHQNGRSTSIFVFLILPFLSASLASFMLGQFYTRWQFSHRDLLSTVPRMLKPLVALSSLKDIMKIETDLENLVDRIMVNMTSDRAFLQRPSKDLDAVWSTLYPKDGMGVFVNDQDPSRIVGFAMFHELHCVHTLLQRHYQAEDIKEAFLAAKPMPTFEHEINHRHTLHCIELLRNAALCHADTTKQYEVVPDTGVPAFGTEYQCRDWQQLVDYVDHVNEERGSIGQKKNIMKHE